MALLPFPVKGRTVFKDHDYDVGWVETVYVLNMEKLDDAVAALKVLAKARLGMLATDITIDAITASQESPQLLGDVATSDGFGVTLNKANVPTYPGEEPGQPDYAWTAQHLRANSGTDYHRNWWLSGIPDQLTLNRLGTIADPDWVKSFNLWAKVLCNGNFGIRAATKNVADSPVTLVKGVDAGGRVLTLAAPYVQPADLPEVFVHGIIGKAPPTSNTPVRYLRPTGRYGVKDITGSTLTIARDPNVEDFTYTKGGYVRPVVYKIFPITTAVLGKTRKKSRGRPLDLLRGRSPARRKR